jgi:hypothetical protein
MVDYLASRITVEDRAITFDIEFRWQWPPLKPDRGFRCNMPVSTAASLYGIALRERPIGVAALSITQCLFVRKLDCRSDPPVALDEVFSRQRVAPRIV